MEDTKLNIQAKETKIREIKTKAIRRAIRRKNKKRKEETDTGMHKEFRKEAVIKGRTERRRKMLERAEMSKEQVRLEREDEDRRYLRI